MIVYRTTFKIKPGRMDEAVALCKAEEELYPAPHAIRTYTDNLAPNDTLAIEFEFENLAEMETFWAGWGAERGAAFFEKINELRRSGGINEIWNLHE